MKYIWVKAEVFLFDNNTGGLMERKIHTSFHPSLVFDFKEPLYTLYHKSKSKYVIGNEHESILTSKDGLFFINDSICSGEVRDCIIRFVAPLADDYLLPKTNFLIREGNWVVGMGKVIEETKPSLFEFIPAKHYD